MAEIKISALTTGTPKGTDLIPAVDTTDTTQAASGTTKKYVRSDVFNYFLSSLGLTTYDAVRVATTLALTVTYNNGALGVGATLTNAGAQAALALDGVTLAVSDRVLVKNQAAQEQNGIYTVTNVGSGATNWVMTRATDFDQAAEVVQYGVVLVDQGTVNAGLLYQETGAGPFTIGTTPIVFAAYTAQSLSLPVSLAQGGTGAALVASNGGIFYSNATTGAILSGTAVANRVLMSGASSTPSWSVPTYPATSGTAGKVLRSDGTNNIYSTSTFADTYAINELLYASAANTVSGLAPVNNAVLTTTAAGVPTYLALADGQLIIGATGAAPAAANLSAGAGISITNAANSITITATGSGIGWNNIAGTTQAAAVDTGYICTNAAQTTVTLPATAAIGATICVEGLGAGGWVLAANVGQTIQIGAGVTSAGGSLTSAAATDNVSVVCIVANTTWRVQRTNSAGLTIA